MRKDNNKRVSRKRKLSDVTMMTDHNVSNKIQKTGELSNISMVRKDKDKDRNVEIKGASKLVQLQSVSAAKIQNVDGREDKINDIDSIYYIKCRDEC